MAAFNLPPGQKSRPKTAFREVGPARLVEPPEEAVDGGPWDRVFVGVHYAEGLSRLFQSGLTQRRKAFNVCYGSLADAGARGFIGIARQPDESGQRLGEADDMLSSTGPNFEHNALLRQNASQHLSDRHTISRGRRRELSRILYRA